ncbi:flagellar brake protein [Oceanobacillus bengalensis]|uniref:Pilus assembly protein PilZ n=1 Tax=Oceanobacillus bengalensis TaxID=1435466 RepID=A0A494Z0X5_9BACI|nr:flagellar brake domain-containing protein [Oceanobacillus bengalensis]RKQ16129.1 hypothetical protein D8M05_08500 [Oceanobacillus bengalensis]
MKIGTTLQIEAEDLLTREIKTYRCKLIEIKEKFLIIDYPINAKTNKTTFFRRGANITVSYVASNTVYQFTSKIIKNVKAKVPGVAIALPEEHGIKRVQRREFVRIDTAIDVAVYSVKNSFTPIITVTSDISGGGMSIIIPQDHSLLMEEQVITWMILPMQTGEIHYIKATAEIVFIKELKRGIFSASLKFIDIDSKVQQNIVRFCFEKQREARKKEIL